jgi:hypothetical protein
MIQSEPSVGPWDGSAGGSSASVDPVKAFGFLLTLILVIGAAVVLSVAMSRDLRTQVEELRARL